MGFEENKQARERAEEWHEAMGEMNPRFWEELGALVAKHLPKTPTTVEIHPPMDEQEAIAFERVATDVGVQYRGTPVGHVPCDYLEYIDTPDTFRIMLRRYLRSDYYKRRRQQEG